MKIQRTTPQGVAADTAENGAEKAAADRKRDSGAQQAPLTDQVTLSPSLTEQVPSRQDSRAERVASVKARIEAGTYRVDSRKIAEKMLSVIPKLTPPPDERR